MRSIAFICAWLFGVSAIAHGDDPTAAEISAAKPDAAGILVHQVNSKLQSGPTQIRVLLPEPLDPARRYPVIYILPVEPGTASTWGDGMLEVKKNDLPRKYPAIFVEPTFVRMPWYADHPTDSRLRQESYLLSDVLPFVEKTYRVQPGRDGRLLLGFSKSGWGAFSLLLRHPDLFARAVAWDAPMMMDWPGKYGSVPIFGTRENFEQYQISALLTKHAAEYQSSTRLILMGYGNFSKDTDGAHELMDRLKIAHKFVSGPKRKHGWGSGWLPEAVHILLEVPGKDGDRR